jgi:hypothetical protein
MKFTILALAALLASAVSAQTQNTVKIVKYTDTQALTNGQQTAGIELSTSKGTVIYGACKSVAPHPITVPQKDGTTVTMKKDDGTPMMAEMNCADLLEHVGEIIPFADDLTDFLTRDSVVDPDSDRLLTTHSLAGRHQGFVMFNFHHYNPKTKVMTDHYVEIRVFDEQVPSAK